MFYLKPARGDFIEPKNVLDKDMRDGILKLERRGEETRRQFEQDHRHEFSTPNFRLISLYDRIFNHNRLRTIIFTCTVREAEHLARFLKLILGDLSK
ncbi:hypothetical protein B0I37DRAFT_419475 [Chaetomium sp. MPI-CAGE-AT-0009]|nr:hypothetical protein B0I37DRAFT_419475 [Chaetomium sp. MPI-CAGE-AT-0009]